MRTNLINDHYEKHRCFIFKNLETIRSNTTSQKLKKMKRIAELIERKGRQKSARINNMLKNARYFDLLIPFSVTLILNKTNFTIANNTYMIQFIK